jgi:hypothetical protein
LGTIADFLAKYQDNRRRAVQLAQRKAFEAGVPIPKEFFNVYFSQGKDFAIALGSSPPS